MNGKKNVIISALVIVFIIAIIALPKMMTEKTQKMNELNYNIILNEDGSMNVTETWDIDIKNTGTLFRTFEDLTEYPITNVEVIDLTTNDRLTNINRSMEQVPEGQYYGLQTTYDTFEIAWGTGKSKSKGNVKYQISYKVDNVITSYNDCQEFYWKLLDSANGISCKKITGNIKLYKPVSNIENLKVWGHGATNGTIKRASNDTIEFDIKNFSAGTMLEIRSVVTEKIFNTTKIDNRNVLKDLLDEEEAWAEETTSQINQTNNITIAILVVEGIILIYGIFRIIKYISEANEASSRINYKGLDYYREIPRENSSTPGEAVYLYNMFTGKDKKTSIISAYILNLCVEGYLEIYEKDSDMYLRILKEPDNLKEDEKIVYELIKQVAMGSNEINIKDLNKFSKKNSREFKEYIEVIIDNIEYNLKREELIERNVEALTRVRKESIMYFGLFGAIIVPFMFKFTNLVLLATIPIFIIEFLILVKLRNNANKLFKLTQSGGYEAEEWNGLRNYLQDYSLIDEKDVFDIKLWEKYLVFATALGISKQVINNLQSKYPDLFTEKYWDINENVNSILNMACNPMHLHNNYNFMSFTNGVGINNISIHTYTITHTSTNSGGSGGSFSSGGGGRWWRWPEWEEDKT